jgi:hypothetical protein
LALVNEIDPDWVLDGVYDLQAEALGHPSEVQIVRGVRAIEGGVVIGEVWENGGDT